MKNFWKNKSVMLPILVIPIFTIGIILVFGNFLQNVQNKLADHLYGSEPSSDNIVIVAIDDKTLDPKIGLGPFSNWDRSYFAKVVDDINKYSPKVIGIDFFFQSEKNAQTDNELAQSLKNTKNPVIDFFSAPEKSQKQNFYSSDLTQNDLPIPELSSLPNITLAISKIIVGTDGVVRSIAPAVFKLGSDNVFYDSFALAVAKRALGSEEKSLATDFSDSTYALQMNNQEKIVPLEDGEMLINFFKTLNNHLNQEYETVNFYDVYNDQNNPTNSMESFFKDKIVLIGGVSNTFKDSYVTPLSNIPMPGVLIHANAIQTILDGKFLSNETPLEKIIFLFILCALGGYIFMFTKIRWSVLFVLGVPTIYAFSAPFAFQHGLILDLIHPFIILPAVFIACYVYRYMTEFREKLELQGAFGKYVNPALVKQIAEHPEALKLGGETRNITVMFTDIVHSTSIEEKLKPESVVKLLSEYFEAMSGVIMSEGGTVDKFEGDGIMALFGAPVAQPDHALRAARAAMKMRLKLAELLEQWKSGKPGPDGKPSNLLPGGEEKPMIDFRCGLSTGEAIVGNMGSSERFDYTALGDVVNLSSRLEGANKEFDTRIMMSEKTYEKVKDEFETRMLGIFQVMGKSEPVKVYELMAPKGQLPQSALDLIKQYNEAMELYYSKKFTEALAKFDEILKVFPDDGPSKFYRQHCEVLRDYPPNQDWKGIIEMGSK